MLRSFVAGIAFTAITLVGSFVAAQSGESTAQRVYKVDNVHSSALFRTGHLGASQLWGRFNSIDGDFTMNEGGATPLFIDMKVKTDSVDTNNASRDKHLRSPDFFNVKEYPEMTFKSTSSRKTGDNRYSVTGDFTMLGKTKPITVELETFGPVTNPRGGNQLAGFETIFDIKRSDYGMKYGIMPDGAGDNVRVIVSIEGGQATGSNN
jgi:polyisoprenoid-binding protein YceI